MARGRGSRREELKRQTDLSFQEGVRRAKDRREWKVIVYGDVGVWSGLKKIVIPYQSIPLRFQVTPFENSMVKWSIAYS